jgi:hypothetical protein
MSIHAYIFKLKYFVGVKNLSRQITKTSYEGALLYFNVAQVNGGSMPQWQPHQRPDYPDASLFSRVDGTFALRLGHVLNPFHVYLQSSKQCDHVVLFQW